MALTFSTSHPAPSRKPGASRRWFRALAAILTLPALAACDDGPVLKPNTPVTPAPDCYDDYVHNLATARTPGLTQSAALAGTALITAAGADGLHIADVSDPANVGVIHTIPELEEALDLALDGATLYVANGNAGLAVVDVSAPAAASVVGTLAVPGNLVDVAVSGARAYVANADLGLVIADVSDPAAPALLGIENSPGAPSGVDVAEPLAFVSDRSTGLRIVNVADPRAPFVIRTVPMPAIANGVAVEDGIALVATEAGLQIVDVAPPSSAAIVGTFATAAGATSVAVAEGVAYVGVGPAGVAVVDVREPAGPVLRTTLGTAGFVLDVALSGERLVVADNPSGARVVDITLPLSPPVETIAAGLNIVALTPYGDHLLAVDPTYGLRVLDAATGAIVGGLAVSGTPRDVVVADTLAYVATSGSAVPEVDVSDPANPVRVRTVLASGAEALAVDGNLLYALSNPRMLIEHPLNGGADRTFSRPNSHFPSLTLDAQYVYLPDTRGTVYMVARNTMTAFVALPLEGTGERVVLRNEDGPFGPGTVPRTYVAVSGRVNGQAGIDCWDTRDPFNTILLSRTPCGGGALDMVFGDSWLVVGEGAAGFEVFSLDAGGIRPAGYAPGGAYRVHAHGGRLLIAGGAQGVRAGVPPDCLRAAANRGNL